MKLHSTSRKNINRCLMGLIGCGLLVAHPAQAATIITIVNPGLEDPAMADVTDTTFDTPLPGWSSDEPVNGGAERYDIRFPGRTGNNVLYIHGSDSQNFYTRGFDLGTNLQSNSSYTLSFDVLSWWFDPGASITQDYVTFRLGLYTGTDYASRVTLREYSGNFSLLDGSSNLLDSVTTSLTFSTGTVAPSTAFWIGGDAFGNAADAHRAHFDNFQLTVVPEPSTLALLALGAFGILALRRRIGTGVVS